jgi:hemerythrin
VSVEWNSTLEIGIPEIDDQHRELVVAVGRLMVSFGENTAEEEVRRLLLFLNQYVTDHFSTEEALMDQHGYPAAEGHKARHAEFIASFRRLIDEFKENGATTKLAQMTQYSVVTWLLNHIGREDKQLGAFLKAEVAT